MLIKSNNNSIEASLVDLEVDLDIDLELEISKL